MNQSCYALKTKTGEYEYLYFLTAQLIDNLKAKGSGSVFKSIIASDIENTVLCIANEKVITLFCDKISPIMKQIKKNTQEIVLLFKQRDELLPLLMNGQVSVNSDLSKCISEIGIVALIRNYPNSLLKYWRLVIIYKCRITFSYNFSSHFASLPSPS